MCAFPAKLTLTKLSEFGETGWAGIYSLLMPRIALLSLPRAEVLTHRFSNAQLSQWQLQAQCLFSSLSSVQPLVTNTSSSQLLPALLSVDPPMEFLCPVHCTQEFHFIADIWVGYCSGKTVQAKTPGKNKQEGKNLNAPDLMSQSCCSTCHGWDGQDTQSATKQ